MIMKDIVKDMERSGRSGIRLEGLRKDRKTSVKIDGIVT
jgi:hypothetical protein